MSVCPAFGASGPDGIADALQKVDCLATQATSVSFGRLFGPGGSFSTVLTILLTLYIAFFAVNLLTGRSALKLSAMTPRMMQVGLVITFVTSWMAYQSVVWNLAVGAPDQIAGVLLGTKSSATIVFAQRLDGLFTAVSHAANAITGNAAAGAGSKLASPANMLWISSLMLLLGTVGVLVVCRIALAALLILGPVFIVMALFEPTRGLFEGWLKSVVMLALVPLLTVLMGSGALVAISPMVAGLESGGTDVSLRTSVSILVASIVYLALMLLVFQLASTLTKGWRVTKAVHDGPNDVRSGSERTELKVIDRNNGVTAAPAGTSERVRSTVANLEMKVSRMPTPVSAPVSTSPSYFGGQFAPASLAQHGRRHMLNVGNRPRRPLPAVSRGAVK